MTQSKKDDTFTIDVSEFDLDNNKGDITINLDDTYGTTTTYWAGDSITDITVDGVSDGTFTIDTSTFNTDTIDINWIYNNMNIDPSEVERMCQEYPALEKTWRNFKSMYDMVKQDYQGKKDAGEIDDDIPF